MIQFDDDGYEVQIDFDLISKDYDEVDTGDEEHEPEETDIEFE